MVVKPGVEAVGPSAKADSRGGMAGISDGPTSPKLRPQEPSGLSMALGRAPPRQNIGVIGGGALATALAMHCTRAGHRTLLAAREEEVVHGINTQRENTLFLPGYRTPDGLVATGDFVQLLAESDVLLLVIPISFLEGVVQGINASGMIRENHRFVCCTKGLNVDTLEPAFQIMERSLPEHIDKVSYLSGPTFPEDLARGKYIATCVASRRMAEAMRVQQALSTSCFRCYTTLDVIGLTVGGALKNVLAIACGICDGLDFGHSGRAALIARGLFECQKIAVAMGAHPGTVYGLSGLGDLVLTSTGDMSKHREVGIRIGKGEAIPQIIASMRNVGEGVDTVIAATRLSEKLGLETPIIDSIFNVLHEGANPEDEVLKCMSRPLKEEQVDPGTAYAPVLPGT